ncbi:winged helix DNA-binding domain-containing protein [Nakamurella lactea]|uniref:winged helix DNA-binding domain-containing protein n=1 Tax=Nakamurella lactea TaxID=459515 RepID=UPI00040B9F2F|nr:winged helix DNA-binding domain-containing protein [Nakamurella lactea]
MSALSAPPVPAPVRRVLTRRLATQRLTSAGLTSAAEVVRLLCCVQSQEPLSASYSLGLRIGGRRPTTLETVRAEIDAGAIIRTHILRPTWHFVAPEDLRWILAATSPKVEQGMAGRHRQLELDERTIGRALEGLTELLAGKNYRTRKQLGPEMTEHGIDVGERLGHILFLAEMRGLICSSPMIGGQHGYALIDEWVAPAPELDAQEATARLVYRFFAGHGPASVDDLVRWCALTKGQIRPALEAIGDGLERIEVDGDELWFDPNIPARPSRRPEALLLPVFDEATLTYPRINFPRLDGHPLAGRPTGSAASSDLASGAVLVDTENVGRYTRTVGPKSVTVRIQFAPTATAEHRERARIGAQAIGAFHGRPITIEES